MKDIIAHRGIHNNVNIPENSLLAFKESLKENIPIELDIRFTKDHEIIVFHDDELERMTNETGFVDNYNLKEIKNIKLLNTDEFIPTLLEVLELINNQVLLDIEVKKTKERKLIVNKTSLLLNNYHNFIIKSFDPWIMKKFKKKLPSCSCGLLVSKNNKLLLNKLLLAYFKPDFIAINKNLIHDKRLKKYATKRQIYIWTINDKDELKRYQNQGDYFICNNLPYNK